jgi:hypothetical protein
MNEEQTKGLLWLFGSILVVRIAAWLLFGLAVWLKS